MTTVTLVAAPLEDAQDVDRLVGGDPARDAEQDVSHVASRR